MKPCFLPKSASTREAALLTAAIERRSGVFLSRASPFQETKAVGMQSVEPFSVSKM